MVSISSWAALDVVAFLCLGGLLVFSFVRRPPAPLWPVLPVFCGLALLWVIGDAGTRGDPGRSDLWMPVEYSGLIWVPPTLWLLAIRFAEAFGSPFGWGRERWTYLPLVAAGVMWIAMVTDPWHGAWLTRVPGQRSEFFAFWWINGFLMNLETGAVLVVYVALRRRHRSWLVRRKAVVMIGASAISLVVSSYYVLFPGPPPFDLGVAGLVGGSGLLALGIYRTGLFNPLPVAVPEILLDDPSGVVLLDTRGYPFFANEAAHRLLPVSVWEGREDFHARFARVPGRAGDDSIASPAALEVDREHDSRTPEEHLYRDRGSPDRLLQIQRIPMRTSRGLELGSCVRLRDVTELHRALAELRAGEERFRALAEHSQDFIVELDDSGRCLYANPIHLNVFGSPPRGLVPACRAIPVIPEDAEKMTQAFAEVSTTGDMMLETVRCFDKHGRIITIEANGRSFVTADGAKRVVISGRDISDRLRAEEQRRRFDQGMREAQKLESLGVLAGGIAHDLNNLLVPVLANANLLLEKATSREERESLREIEDAAVSAGELINQLLAYAGKGKRVIERLDLSSLARRIGELLGSAAVGKAVVHFDLAENLPAIEGDRSQLRQVVMNLVTNAAESFSDGSGFITISTHSRSIGEQDLEKNRAGGTPSPGVHVALEVRDTGCGMGPETLAKIFEPFFTTKRTGRGLGLAALLGIVRAHGGILHVETEVGRGSVFRVLLPSAGRMDRDEVSRAGGETSWSSHGLILLVDDDLAVRRAARRLLESLGFQVTSVRNGPDAVSRFRDHSTELRAVLLDLTMPGMAGDAVFAELRRIRSDVPVILVSGFAQDESFERLDLTGLAGFIQKPYSVRTLRETLQRILGE